MTRSKNFTTDFEKKRIICENQINKLHQRKISIIKLRIKHKTTCLI